MLRTKGADIPENLFQKWGRLILIATTLALVMASVMNFLTGCIDAGPVVDGIVDHKIVTGIKDNTSYTILTNTPGDDGPYVLVKDSDYEGYFTIRDKNAIISESLENEIHGNYLQIKYLVSIRVESSDPINNLVQGDTLAYFASRHDFNKVMIGDKIRYEVARSVHSTIRRLLEVQGQD